MSNKEIMENYGKNFLSVIEEKVATASGFNWLSPVFFSRGNYAYKGKPYKGINQLFLTLIKTVKGYDSSCWITWKKKEDLRTSTGKNIRIKDGEKGYPVIFWKPFQKVDADKKPVLNKKGEPEMVFMLRYYKVFNIEQLDLDGYELNLPELQRNTEDVKDMEDWDSVLLEHYKGNKPAIFHDNEDANFYRPSTDEVHLCSFDRFRSTIEYLGTLAHELGHSTGAKTRLDRFKSDEGFERKEYSREELVAEMTSCMVQANFGITETMNNSAEYLKNWMQFLKKEPDCLVTAYSKAEKAANWILGNEQDYEENEAV